MPFTQLTMSDGAFFGGLPMNRCTWSGHDLGLGQFEALVLTDFREDGFETFLRLPVRCERRYFGTNTMW